MAWRPSAPAKTRRQFDTHAAERRARIHVENAALVLVLFGVRAWVLGKGRAGDVAYSLAQRRGERLARKMHADGTLKARSPRKVVRLP